LFVEAVLYRYRAGIPWRDLPERFGDWKNTHRRFSRWAKSGVWKHVFEHLAADADHEYGMIDSTIVRAHQHSAGPQKRRQRPGSAGQMRPFLYGTTTLGQPSTRPQFIRAAVIRLCNRKQRMAAAGACAYAFRRDENGMRRMSI
jgi:transposase